MAQAKAASVSVIIVSWNAQHHLRGCLDSLRASRPACVLETIVVDNDSADGSAEMVEQDYPEVQLVRAGANLGFAKANNLAMRMARGSIFALVNSDALVHPGCLEALVSHLEQHPEVGLVGPRVNGGDGGLQLTCRRLPGLLNTFCRSLALDRLAPGEQPWGGYELSARQHERTREVEVLSGCFCVARRAVVEQVGGMDERFFFYGEDIDWCKRIGDGGWKLAFVSQAHATHYGGGSSSGARVRFSVEMMRATITYWRKHYGRISVATCRLLLIQHHALRLLCRSVCRLLPGARPDHGHRNQEHLACLRWLVFGTEPVRTPPARSAAGASA